MDLTRKLEILVLSFAAGALPAFAAEQQTTPDDKRVPEARPIISRQNQIGNGVVKSVGEIRDLIDDAKQNPDIELPGKSMLNDAPPVLDDISRIHVPKVIDGIRTSREPGAAATGLRKGCDESEAIVNDFAKLLATLKKSLAPAETQHLIDTAIEKQRIATDAAREAREKNEGLEGKPPEKLNNDEKNTLRTLLTKQRDATTALTNVMKHLNENAPGDPNDKNALEHLNNTGAEAKSKETHNDINDNHLRTAERKGEEIIGALTGAKSALDPDHANPDPETKLGDLKRIKEDQEGVKHDTENLDPKNGNHVGETAEGQGKVSKTLGEMGKNDPELGKAAEHSRGAADDIASGKPGEALKKQQGVLDAINNAIKNTEAQIAAAKPSENSKKPQESKKGVQDTSKVAQNAAGTFEYGTPIGHLEGWNVALQAKDRVDVEQAVAEKMPAKYAAQIKLYYMSLQGARAGD